jgi:hypothetical protein
MNLAPNGKKSNLTNEQYKLVRTKAFKKWFGDWEKLAYVILKDPAIDDVSLENFTKDVSKVVDSNLEPLVCYHGTTSVFNEFNVGRTNGIFFTNRKETADRFSSGDLKRIGNSPKVLECFLKINKLYDKNTNDEILINNYYQDFFKNRPFIKKQSQKNILKDKFNKYFMDLVSFGIVNDEPKIFLLKYEYDGISINSDNNAKSYIVFNSNQIKLADGTNTTFDANNPDIRYKNGGNMETEYKVMFESRSGSGNVREVRVNAKNFNDAKKKGWIKSGLNKKFYAFLTAHEIKAVGGMMAMQILSTGYTLHNNVKPYQYSIGGL